MDGFLYLPLFVHILLHDVCGCECVLQNHPEHCSREVLGKAGCAAQSPCEFLPQSHSRRCASILHLLIARMECIQLQRSKLPTVCRRMCWCSMECIFLYSRPYRCSEKQLSEDTKIQKLVQRFREIARERRFISHGRIH